MTWNVKINRVVSKDYAEKENQSLGIEDEEIRSAVKKISEIKDCSLYVKTNWDKELLESMVYSSRLIIKDKVKEDEVVLEFVRGTQLSYDVEYLLRALNTTIEGLQQLKGEELLNFLDTSITILHGDLYGIGSLNQTDKQKYKNYIRRLNSDKVYIKREQDFYHKYLVKHLKDVFSELYTFLKSLSKEDLQQMVVVLDYLNSKTE